MLFSHYFVSHVAGCFGDSQFISLFVKGNSICFEYFSGMNLPLFVPLVMEHQRSSSESGRKLISLYTRKKVKNGIFIEWKKKLSKARKKDLRASYREKQMDFLFIYWHLIENWQLFSDHF